MKIVGINTENPYDVLIERGIFNMVGELMYSYKNRHLLIITDENVNMHYGKRLNSILSDSGFSTSIYVIPAGESSKSFGILAELMEFMSEHRIRRSDVILAFGGGVVGDLAGFAAGIYQRGMSYIQIPTTLLAAVDSSVGGKTAINLKSGKNMVGIFKQPELVICDPNLFKTLSDYHFADGLAETIKYAVLFDAKLFKRLKTPLTVDSEDLESVIERCVSYKAAIVREDEFDHGKRQLLNLGHTIGHAIEKASSFDMSHGHAVSSGLAIISRACSTTGLCSDVVSNAIQNVLTINDLPVSVPYSPELLLEYAKGDKKSGKSKINTILIKEIGNCIIKPLSFEELGNLIRAGISNE